MSTVTVTSNDTLTLNNRVMVDLAFDDVSSVAFPNELLTLKTGKNGNSIFAQNANGLNATLTMRLTRGSSDDQFMQNILAQSGTDFPSLALINGTFVKRLGDGAGNIVSDVYTLRGGAISRQIDGKENVSGDVNQGEAIYMVRFANATRNIG